ncbi:PROTEIN YY1 [Salix viminalis]|uniref:PROTEIN YY1 n=2 Tax=Salix viminalis TaxID=40686 RepID=A0A9Q0NLQ2_SALVM|nr:PROTEIN YY1 [Salix viminalis]
MASLNKFLIRRSPAALLLLLVALAVQTQLSQSQQCTSQLNSLNICAPFVVPGAPNTNPSSDCCNAIGALQHDVDCLCSTLQIAARLPSQCNLPPITCGNQCMIMKLNLSEEWPKNNPTGVGL